MKGGGFMYLGSCGWIDMTPAQIEFAQESEQFDARAEGFTSPGLQAFGRPFVIYADNAPRLHPNPLSKRRGRQKVAPEVVRRRNAIHLGLQAANAAGHTQTSISEGSGVGMASIATILSGRSRRPKDETMAKLETWLSTTGFRCQV